ncbi:hypothetical protein NDU88_004303 [Pleurodeles waltl]|uniref:Uncharacterized protein n=1 Tax=Pleurodeles waltl TaxID=8319 RepID=A0AAV7WUP6_PLEWA|nr:hypothetical protein NDU88_004303 [Pleurodeles waltl]
MSALWPRQTWGRHAWGWSRLVGRGAEVSDRDTGTPQRSVAGVGADTGWSRAQCCRSPIVTELVRREVTELGLRGVNIGRTPCQLVRQHIYPGRVPDGAKQCGWWFVDEVALGRV